MKLLLTSAGITNKSLSKALFDLVGKKPEETTLVFIPTASNVEKERGWVDEDLELLRKLSFKQIETADISTMSKDKWRPIFENSDVLYFEGGNTYYLMEWINKSGLSDMLPELLKTKVWVGVSAGSMVTNPNLDLIMSQELYGEDLDKEADMPALNLVNFYFIPHLNSKYFDKLTIENIEKSAKRFTDKIYTVDDEGAVQFVDGNIEVISEGIWKEWN